MNTKITNVLAIALIVLSIAIGAYLYPILPDRIVSHWNAQGVADGTMPKFWGIFLLPMILVAMYLLYVIMPKIDPLKNNIVLFRKTFNEFWIAISLFMFYIYAMSMAWNLGYRFDFVIALTPAMAILWWVIGRLMLQTRRNWFIGIRTPWTLSDDTVWDKTHKLGGRLFQATAIITLAGVIFPSALMYLILIPSLGSVLITFIYSYILYRQIHPNI